MTTFLCLQCSRMLIFSTGQFLCNSTLGICAPTVANEREMDRLPTKAAWCAMAPNMVANDDEVV
eukprot:CAMPEP_0183702258 /NCGR_PEP_ID=MMETSP0737-20130205/421_1 /TAXON_ID=385413 /ORGANISM="Thalassiosira miniscula, Strain CCMP1093" /LENGTH=63 /DNA_ID=CAMNT_0025928833 /DNA_START=629 /DNA_END=820 /DNA_ORIENTATION=+